MPKSPANCHKPGKEPKQLGKDRPTFEEAAKFYIENKTDRARALSFAKWLEENEMPLTSGGGYNWYIDLYYLDSERSQGKYFYHREKYHACYIKLYYGTWHIFPAVDILEKILFYSELKEVLWESVYPCYGCKRGCYKSPDAVQYKKTIFGREYVGKEVCTKTPICFSNPDAKTLRILKKILFQRTEEDLFMDFAMSLDNYTIMLK